MTTPLPPADPASPWMQHLERAHSFTLVAVRAVGEAIDPSPHLAPAALHLARAIGALYDAFDGRAVRVTAINLAHGRLWDAAVLIARAGLAGAVDALQSACAELIQAEERSPRVPLAPRPPESIRAALDLPPLHVIERASLVPVLRAPPEPEPEVEPAVLALPEPTTFEELAAVAAMIERAQHEQLSQRRRLPASQKAPPEAPPVPPAGFAIVPRTISDDAFVQGWARHCFEEIGMLGLQRTPLAGDDWRTSATIERRMLHAVDAMAALGPIALSYLEPLAMDAPVANPMTVFAIALLGGCFEGRDLLGAAERVLFHYGPRDPVVADAFVSAMKLAPNPFIPGMLRSLLHLADPGCKAIAVEVLSYRAWLTEAELGTLAEDEDARILALALPALAMSRHRDLDRAIDRGLAHADLRVQAAALDAMALGAHPDAAGAARASACGDLGDEALVRLAIVADESDARWLLARAKASPGLAAIEALGWAGLVEAVPTLIDLLESGEDEAKAAAGEALERLLGANLIEAIEVQPDEVEDRMMLDPDPDPPKLRPSLAKLVSHPRDMPSAGSPETLEVASQDPAKWRAYWAQHGRQLDSKARVRRGRPYSPSVSLWELDRLPLGPGDRRRLHLEMAARTGRVVRFETHDLVVVQERSLAAWSSHVDASAVVPGSWSRRTGLRHGRG